jgi:hypothetical protein
LFSSKRRLRCAEQCKLVAASIPPVPSLPAEPHSPAGLSRAALAASRGDGPFNIYRVWWGSPFGSALVRVLMDIPRGRTREQPQTLITSQSISGLDSSASARPSGSRAPLICQTIARPLRSRGWLAALWPPPLQRPAIKSCRAQPSSLAR